MIAVGAGCSRGCGADELLALIDGALAGIGLASGDVAVLATAGSIFNRASPKGIRVPHRPAMNRLTIIATPMTTPIR